MARDLGALAARLSAVSVELVAGVEGYVAEVCVAIGKTLVPATPVDTGLARGNWRPSLNVPVSRPTSLVDASGAGAIARIASVAAQYRVGSVFYLVNRVPYIGALNAGSSPQAPAGFVESSVRAAVRSVSRRRGLLGGD